MSREIKFRAWNGTEMLDNGNLSEHYIGDLNGHFESIMQYTGLKDKNGKDIYEGDILNTEDGIEVVKIDLGCFVHVSKDFVTYAYNWHLEEVEVIGNIHENPELLK